MDLPLKFTLEAYEGPLDLLLDLIRKQQIDIYNIPIAQITQQYLEYIRGLEAQDIEVSGEFILMAATLIQIKSKLLLPKDPDIPEDQQEDPRAELVNQLLEHEKFKSAAEMLHERQMLESASWSNPAQRMFVDDSEEPGLAVTLYDLVKTFQSVLDRARSRPRMDIQPEEISTAEMIRMLRDRLAGTRAPVALSELFEEFDSRRNLITLFLAILEMVRLQAIVLRQKETFADIVLRKHRGFEALYSERRLEEILGDEQAPDKPTEPPAENSKEEL